ncbi:MAG: aminotransferase class I/II-fold pyridoxal phosphate-dependent enzyme [Alistipes sp.]|nr:aminotransferase class I/II-fold pyridoxal phosphate-dependent enzyme [Alistipes sp.]
MSGEEQRYIQEAFDTEWVAPLGPNVDAFELELERYMGEGRHVAALSSGTAAVHTGLILSGVDRGDEVICQSWTFAASANPVVYQGAVPVFVDSEPDTWNISPELMEEAIRDRIAKRGRKPKAIVAVHMYGMPARMTEIMEIAGRYGIPVVEDAAEAMGSRYDGRMCGTFGEYGVLSFNGNKMITTGGGGALACPSAEMKRRALFYATQAREPFPYYQHEHIGYNYRMSNIAAGIGRGQMTVVEVHAAHHRRLAALYAELFADTPGIEVHLNPSERFDSNYWLNTILIDPEATGTDYESVRRHLESCNVESRPLWKPMHLQPVYKEAPRYENGVSAALFGRGLCLPSGPCVSEDDVIMIANEIKKCIKH